MANIPINIREGFLVHWCEEFLHHYGEESEFPKALSDLYTIKVAKIMEKKGDFDPEIKLGLFLNDAAVDSIRALIRANESAGTILYKEAFGTISIGAAEMCINEKFGEGIFTLWLHDFEKKNYEGCLDLFTQLH